MNSEPVPPLNIAIIGAGRIGSAYAFQLARAGHDVTVVARPGSRRLAQLQGDQAIILTTDERASVTVADKLDEQTPYNLVIVTTLAHQVDPLLPVLRASQAKRVHFMFVTPEAEHLRGAVGTDRVTFGMAAVQATLDHNGKLSLTIGQAKSRQGDPRWVDVFEAAGLPSALEPQMGRWLRSQTPLTIAIEGVAASGHHGRGATWAQAQAGAQALRAGFLIIRELGETPYPRSKDQMSRAPLAVLSASLWGISRSRLRETTGNSAEECRGLIDLLVGEARQKPELQDAVDALLALRPDHAA